MTDPADQTETLAGVDATSPPVADDSPQQAFGGRYVLTGRIASGGMASVWKAHDQVLARTVAVKVLHDHLAADDAFRERFRREAIAAAKLTHPNVVSLFDTGADGEHVYLVMEFVDGATLKDVIADLGSLEPGQAASIGEKVARALDYAHERGLVHRDVKPANILIGDDGTVKVADFGIAKAEEAEGDLTKTGMVLGTAAYVAPEQITGSRLIDGRADQYALGCMLYEALSGRQPFKGDSAVATAAQRLDSDPPPLRALRPDVPRGLEAIVLRALARDSDDRYPSAGVMADALAAFADADAGQTAALAAPAGDSRVWAASAPAPPRPESRPAARSRRAAPAAERPARRGDGRWVTPVVALLLLAGALIGLGLASGTIDVPALPATERPAAGGDDAGSGGQRQAPDPEPVRIVGASSFDPQGGGDEHDEELPALYDGDPASSWQTETYSSPDFGGLPKDGVGFYVDVGARQRLKAVRLATDTPGVNYEIHVADQPAAALADWTQVGSVTGASANSEVSFDEAVEARYLLVWITAPLPADGHAAFSDITLLGEPA